jgi:hypothetical protein
MRRKLGLALVPVVAVLALALSPALSGAASAPIKVKCKGRFTSLTPGKLKGSDVGLVKCGSPLGKGIQWINYTETISKTGAVTASGFTKAWYDLGTIAGGFKTAGQLTGATATLKGTAKITGGTGVYSKAKGTATITCVTKDAGATLSCTDTVKFTKF